AEGWWAPTGTPAAAADQTALRRRSRSVRTIGSPQNQRLRRRCPRQTRGLQGLLGADLASSPVQQALRGFAPAVVCGRDSRPCRRPGLARSGAQSNLILLSLITWFHFTRSVRA